MALKRRGGVDFAEQPPATFYSSRPRTTPPRPRRLPSAAAQALLAQVRLVLLTDPIDRRRLQTLLGRHHYLGRLQAVGEQLHYAAVDAQGQWVAVLLFSAAAQHLKPRDAWIGWSRAQRDRRRALVVKRLLLTPLHESPDV